MEIKLQPAKKSHQDQKYIVQVGKKNIGFGLNGMSDFTQNKQEERKNAYISRHQKREIQFWDPNNLENLKTASFWSRFLLWEKPNIFDAIQNIENISGVKIKYTQSAIEKQQRSLKKAIKKSGEDQD